MAIVVGFISSIMVLFIYPRTIDIADGDFGPFIWKSMKWGAIYTIPTLIIYHQLIK